MNTFDELRKKIKYRSVKYYVFMLLDVKHYNKKDIKEIIVKVIVNALPIP